MAKARRRSARNKTVESSEEKLEAVVDLADSRPDEEVDKCPACKNEDNELWNAADKENWVQCDACKAWYHWRCVGNGGDLESIDKWYCKDCLTADSTRSISFKPPARKSSRKRTQRDYADLHSGVVSDPNKWMKMLEGKVIENDNFRRISGSEVNLSWLEHDESAMKEPVVIEDPEGLGLKMPSDELTIQEIAEILGEDTPIEVIDVASQRSSSGWTLGKWAEYYSSEPSEREKLGVKNVISLEISGTKLGDQVLPPKLVRELDWVENYWPSTKKGKGNPWPKVQLYCLMGVAGAWTDWHVDFAGSSVYYHILWGQKVFYFIQPTPANLAAYERWSNSAIQNNTWLGDLVDRVCKVELTQGNTMIIPTGWIHAVYTPTDTLVFGGNFLHSQNVATQFKIRDIEVATRVPKKFQFPLLSKLCWYVGDKYLKDIKAKEEFPSRVVESIEALADFLVAEARIMERGAEAAKKEAREQVPADRIKDAPALARELRWRIRQIAGHASDGEDESKTMNGLKRKLEDDSPTMFRNFRPRKWDRMIDRSSQEEVKSLTVQKPDSLDNWTDGWIDTIEPNSDEAGEDAELRRSRTVIIKARRTETGVERQRIERILEHWTWRDGREEEKLEID